MAPQVKARTLILSPDFPCLQERIEKLIDDLASEDFKARAKASRELGKYGDWAEPFLRKAVETEKRLEPRQRLEAALKQINRIPLAEEVNGWLIKVEPSKLTLRLIDKEGKKAEAGGKGMGTC